MRRPRAAPTRDHAHDATQPPRPRECANTARATRDLTGDSLVRFPTCPSTPPRPHAPKASQRARYGRSPKKPRPVGP
jgi:hypothetical protein